MITTPLMNQSIQVDLPNGKRFIVEAQEQIWVTCNLVKICPPL